MRCILLLLIVMMISLRKKKTKMNLVFCTLRPKFNSFREK